MYKINKLLSPAYLQDLFSIRNTKYNLRDSENREEYVVNIFMSA